jgi:plasmid stabilization system protein ParE
MNNGSKYVIEWTIHAKNELDALFDYLENNWSVREITRFPRLLDKKIVYHY